MPIILGSLSGIQTFLLDTPETGGGQAQQIRARSFALRIAAEVCALRLLRALDLPDTALLFSAAGKFALAADTLTPEQNEAINAERVAVANHLFSQAGQQIRYQVGVSDVAANAPLRVAYDAAQAALLREKMRPGAAIFAAPNGWQPEKMVLPQGKNTDDRYESLGQALPRAAFVGLYDESVPGATELAGWFVRVAPTRTGLPTAPRPVRVYALSDGATDVPRLRTARHVATENNVLLDFDELAKKATGAPYLGVLKMDADGLGAVIGKTLDDARDWHPLQNLSDRLDTFFAVQLEVMMQQPRYADIYTVFSGGDDLLLVAPWNVLFDFAFAVRQAFAREFAADGLTISGGLAVVSRRTPIRRGAAQAEELLEHAKTKPAPGYDVPKDSFAAFGQVWKWRDHETVDRTAHQLIAWVERNTMERGWLHTLLGHALNESGDPLNAARLQYHVHRNYPEAGDRDPHKSDLREWANRIVREIDRPQSPDAVNLVAILRYALLATRHKGEKE